MSDIKSYEFNDDLEDVDEFTENEQADALIQNPTSPKHQQKVVYWVNYLGVPCSHPRQPSLVA